ncbi:YaaA family protein [Psychromicrobium lacuslunae]|uniref:Uncharacterized protein n=1 Tax=Psychromicrobium lacuslunae TaxID=1618207 RepID=A0A0D4BY03_9MICC|nr:peroxide stress protein YaaA [Psychromicrobium lacuslunae]AJT41189.1 hypothetical protein UM93_06055 [Psychromicrobium lacuslunae]
MLILLPPSEGKTAAVDSRTVELTELSFPELSEPRKQVLEALRQASLHPEALKHLGVGPSLAAEVARNTRLLEEAAAPAHQVYSGVLYDALGYQAMTQAQRARADEAVLIISGLWGVVRFGDRIPAYRLSMSVSLPGLGRLASFWRPLLSKAMDERASNELVVDCRSSNYTAAWAPPAENTVEVNVFQERNGKRTVVSHFAKHTRGELAGLLLRRRGSAPQTPRELLKVAQRYFNAELTPGTAKKPHSLNLILAAGVSFAKAKSAN